MLTHPYSLAYGRVVELSLLKVCCLLHVSVLRPFAVLIEVPCICQLCYPSTRYAHTHLEITPSLLASRNA